MFLKTVTKQKKVGYIRTIFIISKEGHTIWLTSVNIFTELFTDLFANILKQFCIVCKFQIEQYFVTYCVILERKITQYVKLFFISDILQFSHTFHPKNIRSYKKSYHIFLRAYIIDIKSLLGQSCYKCWSESFLKTNWKT